MFPPSYKQFNQVTLMSIQNNKANKVKLMFLFT